MCLCIIYPASNRINIPQSKSFNEHNNSVAEDLGLRGQLPPLAAVINPFQVLPKKLFSTFTTLDDEICRERMILGTWYRDNLKRMRG